MPRLNSCTCRRDRRKCSRSALSRLPNSRLDKADIALPIPTEFGYVTANGPFIHKHNRLFTKTRLAGVSCDLPRSGLRPLFGQRVSTLELRKYRVSLGNCLCLVAVPDRPQIVLPPRTHPVYRGLNLCEHMSPNAA